MSNRTLVELNHDFCPVLGDKEAITEFGHAIVLYMRTGDKTHLPAGVTFKQMRHHLSYDPMHGHGDPA